jgi:hypothetical protein
MIPAGAIAAGVAAALAARANAAGKPPMQPPRLFRASAEGRVGTWAVFVWTVLAPGGLTFLLLTLAGQVWAIIPLAAIVLLAFPWPIARTVLVPLGQARLAYWLTYASDVVFHLDRRGGAALAGAWALAMQRELDEETAEWIAARLAEERPLRGAGVAAAAMLLAARGDRDGARALFAVVEAVDDRACPPAAKRLANAWLASDAAERGEWARVAALGMTWARGGRLGWLLAGIAQSLLLEPSAPKKYELWLRWAIAPQHAATKPMVERALVAQEGGFIDPEEEPPLAPEAPPEGADAIRTALSLHAAVLAKGAVRAEDVRAVGQAWDAALEDRATERLLYERALVLGASGPAATLMRVRSAIEEDLAAVVLASGMPLKDLGEKGELTTRVRARLRDRMLSEVEAASDVIRRRVEDKRELPPVEEWREWASLADRYERGVESAGEDFRRLAFAKVYPDACGLAVWLFNDRQQRPLGNAIFRWLLAEAEVLDDQRAIALQTKNVACGV